MDQLQNEIQELFADLWQVPRFSGLRAGFRPQIDCYRTADPAELVVANGENLNGENLNGENLNGENLNGAGLGANVQYVSFAGASIGGQAFDSVWLEGTVLHGTSNRSIKEPS